MRPTLRVFLTRPIGPVRIGRIGSFDIVIGHYTYNVPSHPADPADDFRFALRIVGDGSWGGLFITLWGEQFGVGYNRRVSRKVGAHAR